MSGVLIIMNHLIYYLHSFMGEISYKRILKWIMGWCKSEGKVSVVILSKKKRSSGRKSLVNNELEVVSGQSLRGRERKKEKATERNVSPRGDFPLTVKPFP